MSEKPAVLAVDGGDSKTEVMLVSTAGDLLGMVRVNASSHFGLGHDGSDERLEQAIQLACQKAGIVPDGLPIAPLGVYCLAGDDLPVDDQRIATEVGLRNWTKRNLIRNDTFAVLRAGTDRGWGIAVVCGSGLNCSGIGPDGAIVRFPALGEISGDGAAGGGWLGMQALGAAIRAEDGRGEATILEQVVPAHFQMTRPFQVMEAIYLRRLDDRRLLELPPVIFAAAAQGDAIARRLIETVAAEIVTISVATLRRLELLDRDVEVILGGGIFESREQGLLRAVSNGIHAVAPAAITRVLDAPPVLGAALIGLDDIQVSSGAIARLRSAVKSGRVTANP